MKEFTVRFSIPIVLVLVVILGGCTESPLDPGPTRTPGVGSWYAYSRVDTDSSRTAIPRTESRDTLTVTSTGNTFDGRSNLHLLESSRRHIYLSYEPNADVLSISPEGCDCLLNWIPYVIGSKKTTTLPGRDTVLSSGTQHWTITEVMRHDGTESITVPAGTFDTHKLTLTSTSKVVGPAMTATAVTTTTYYFAPSIGYLAKVVRREESFMNTNTVPTIASGSEQVLLGYEVK